jgi:hypothetical protein
MTPSQVSAVYREAGYDFLALTDHFLEQYDFPLTEVPLADERFVGIRAAELHAGRMANGELWHMVAVGLPPGFAPPPPHETVVWGNPPSVCSKWRLLSRRQVNRQGRARRSWPRWSGRSGRMPCFSASRASSRASSPT